MYYISYRYLQPIKKEKALYKSGRKNPDGYKFNPFQVIEKRWVKFVVYILIPLSFFISILVFICTPKLCLIIKRVNSLPSTNLITFPCKDSAFFFAFSSIIGNYYYGETNLEFINTSKTLLIVYRVFVVIMVILGTIAPLGVVWAASNIFMSLMALINLIVILLLGKKALDALEDYRKQKEYYL